MENFFIVLVAALPMIDGQGSGNIQRSLDACSGRQCPSTEYCNVIYTDGDEDKSECVTKCPTPSVPNKDGICQDYCSQPENPCADNPKEQYCHRQNTGNMYRCMESCPRDLSPPSTDNICTDACSPNPCASEEVCTPSANGNHACSASCAIPRVEDAGRVCVDACNPNFCPSNRYCTRSGSSYKCVDSCAANGLDIDGDSKVCKDFCNPNPCSQPKLCNGLADGYECLDTCPWPKLKKDKFICKDPCLPSGCPHVFYCKRNGEQRDCIISQNCPDDHFKDTSTSICLDGCANNQCEADSKICLRQNTSPGYICSSSCPYPYTKDGSVCVDPCYPTNPCKGNKYCLRNGLNSTCVSKKGCPSNFYANSVKKTCEDPCKENLCTNGTYCHREGKARICQSECSLGYLPENNNPFICQKATTLASSTTLNVQYTSAYEGGSSSSACQNAFNGVVNIIRNGLNQLNAGRSHNQGCRPGSVVVDIVTEFASTNDDEPANVTSEQLSETLDNVFENIEANENVTFSNGTMYFINFNITIIPGANTSKVLDFDECQDETYNLCPDYTTCNNTPGGYICDCFSGYESHGLYCEEIDNCKKNTTCDVNASCMSKLNGYDCVCKDGYSGNGNTCQDINECSGSTNCLVNQTCQNYQGGYLCNCPIGQYNTTGSCIDVYTYESEVTAYQDSVFEANYFTKEKNTQLENKISNLYYTFGEQFCQLVTKAFEAGDYSGCKVTGYRVKPATTSRRSISDTDQITISFNTFFTNTQKAADIASSLRNGVIHNGTDYNTFYNMNIKGFPVFKVVCQKGEVNKVDYCEPDVQPATNECDGGCAKNAECVAESGKLKCLCVYGYTGDGKTKCIMSDMNRLRWILVGINTVLLASFIIIVFFLVRIKKRVSDEGFRASEVLMAPSDFIHGYGQSVSLNSGSQGVFRPRPQARDLFH